MLRECRMALFITVLLILVRFPSIYVTSSVIISKVCGADLFTYSSSLEHELFYKNGVVIDKVSFCQALESHKANKCCSEPGSGEQEDFDMSFCGLDVSLLMHPEMPHRAGRKILLDSDTKENKNGDSRRKGRPIISKHDSISLLDPKVICMALPGMFIVCCCLLCPCIRPRPKETSRAVLTNNPNSMDTFTPLEVSSASENIPGSPVRAPGPPFRVPPSPSRFSMSPRLSRVGSVHLNISQVMKATQNFSPQLKIGEGGFGTVYRAQLQDGQVVAIKRAKKEFINTLQAEFSSEVQLLAKIEHRCLVRLLGYVDQGNERIIITEHVPNGSLREHLDGQHGKILDFYQRLEISIDVAHALTYLHLYAEKQIIHRDVKSSNILLTESFRAKVADFGFARYGPTEEHASHILTKVKGTAGYLDPEYLRTYQLTHKSDVYSFGILLTEILTGRRPVEPMRALNGRVTIRWAFDNYHEGNVVGLLDPLIKEVVNTQILSKIFGLAFQCAAPTRLDRPEMREVGEQLWLVRKEYLKSAKRG